MASFFRMDARGGEKPVVENLARWPETGFFREFFVTAEDIAKNPVSLVFMRGEKPGFFREYRSTAEKLRKTRFLWFLGMARNRVFSENIVPPPKNCEKPGFFGIYAWPETGFFPEFFVTAEAIAKNPVSLVVMRGQKVTVEAIAKNPVSLVLRRGQKPGFFQNPLLQPKILRKTRFLWF